MRHEIEYPAEAQGVDRVNQQPRVEVLEQSLCLAESAKRHNIRHMLQPLSCYSDYCCCWYIASASAASASAAVALSSAGHILVAMIFACWSIHRPLSAVQRHSTMVVYRNQ